MKKIFNQTETETILLDPESIEFELNTETNEERAARLAPKIKTDHLEPSAEADAITAFVNGSVDGTFGKYRIHGDELLIQKIQKTEVSMADTETVKHLMSLAKKNLVDITSHDLKELKCQMMRTKSRTPAPLKYRRIVCETVARRFGNSYVGDSSMLSNDFAERNGFTKIQETLSEVVPMIPFSVFRETGLDITKYKLVETGPQETLTISVPEKYTVKVNEKDYKGNVVRDKNGKAKKVDETRTRMVDEERHFIGAQLFQVDGRSFLLDVDRVELEYKRFNAFLSIIPGTPDTIADAYQSLIPSEVQTAIDSGSHVIRQGEFFFVPAPEVDTDNAEIVGRVKSTAEDLLGSRYTTPSFEIRAGRGRPNYAAQGFQSEDGLAYIRGFVVHSGREHEPIKLRCWHKVIPNTATENFTLVGDID
jgi:hypothetical protein